MLAIAMCVCMLSPYLDGTVRVFAQEDTGLCEHHPEHTDECGYIAPKEGAPCLHKHNDECNWGGGEILLAPTSMTVHAAM